MVKDVWSLHTDLLLNRHKAHNSCCLTYFWTAPLPIWWVVPLIGFHRHNQLVIIPLEMLVTLVRSKMPSKKLSMQDGLILSSAKYQLTAFQIISKSRKNILYFLVSCENRWLQKKSKSFAEVQPDAYEFPQHSDITSNLPVRYNLFISGVMKSQNTCAR